MKWTQKYDGIWIEIPGSKRGRFDQPVGQFNDLQPGQSDFACAQSYDDCTYSGSKIRQSCSGDVFVSVTRAIYIGIIGMLFLFGCGAPEVMQTKAENKPAPLPVEDLVSRIAPPTKTLASVNLGGFYCYILLADQKTYCKGKGTSGQLGDGLFVTSTLPVEVLLPVDVRYFVDVQVGYKHACGLSGSGQIYCWGSGSDGKIGQATNANAATPVPIKNPFGTTYFTDLMVGYSHACAIDQDSRTFCWGKGSAGQMGNGLTHGANATLQQVIAPNPVDHTEFIRDLQPAQGDFTCGITNYDNVYCWGSNALIALKHASDAWFSMPEKIIYPDANQSVASVRSGTHHTCGELQSLVFFCWGNNDQGQRGMHTDNVTPYFYESNNANTPEEYAVKLFPGDSLYCVYTNLEKLYCNQADGYGTFDKVEVSVPGNVALKFFQPGTPSIGVTVDDKMIEITL